MTGWVVGWGIEGEMGRSGWDRGRGGRSIGDVVVVRKLHVRHFFFGKNGFNLYESSRNKKVKPFQVAGFVLFKCFIFVLCSSSCDGLDQSRNSVGSKQYMWWVWYLPLARPAGFLPTWLTP